MLLCNNPSLEIPESFIRLWDGLDNVVLILDSASSGHIVEDFALAVKRASGAALVVVLFPESSNDLMQLGKSIASITQRCRELGVAVDTEGGKVGLLTATPSAVGWQSIIAASRLCLLPLAP